MIYGDITRGCSPFSLPRSGCHPTGTGSEIRRAGSGRGGFVLWRRFSCGLIVRRLSIDFHHEALKFGLVLDSMGFVFGWCGLKFLESII